MERGACAKIKNSWVLVYDYIYNLELPPVKVVVHTNEVVTKVEDKLFKQWTHQTTFELPCRCCCLETIQRCNAYIMAMQGKVIETKYSCYVLVTGEINYEVFCKYRGEEKVFQHVRKEGFSCLIRVPNSAIYCEVNNIQAMIEDITARPMGRNCVMLSSQLLIKLY